MSNNLRKPSCLPQFMDFRKFSPPLLICDTVVLFCFSCHVPILSLRSKRNYNLYLLVKISKKNSGDGELTTRES